MSTFTILNRYKRIMYTFLGFIIVFKVVQRYALNIPYVLGLDT